MPTLCYEIQGPFDDHPLSTTGAKNGRLSAIIKGDHHESLAQVYSELVANRLAAFLGIPVVAGVVGRDPLEPGAPMQFASLKAHEAGLDVYDFTADLDPMEEDEDFEMPPGMFKHLQHPRATKQLCEKYPVETAYIAVFDLWICNLDRDFNFKADLKAPDRGVIFALDHGSSLLSCASSIERSLDKMHDENTPMSHPFQSLVTGRLCGQMVERIMSLPEWALESATTYDDTIGNVILPDQFATYAALLERRKNLGALVDRVLISPT